MSELDPLMEVVKKKRLFDHVNSHHFGSDEESSADCPECEPFHAIEAVLAIQPRTDDSPERAKVLIDYGYNIALSNVRFAIAQALGVEG